MEDECAGNKGCKYAATQDRTADDGSTRGVWLTVPRPGRSSNSVCHRIRTVRTESGYATLHAYPPSSRERRLSLSGELVRSEPEHTRTHGVGVLRPTANRRHSTARRLAMALKILGWGTMVGVAFLAITSLKTWMAPLTSRAAQMVCFVEPLACPNGP